MTTRSRTGSTRGKSAPPKPGARSARHEPATAPHATTPDARRQEQALANQGTQGRMAPAWRTRFGEDDEDADDTPPTLH